MSGTSGRPAGGPGKMSDPSRPRRRRFDTRNGPVILVLGLAGAGLIYVGLVGMHWLRGVLVLAAAMLLAGGFRAFLPVRRVGPLAVRGRTADIVCYVGVGVLLIVLGLWLRSTGSVGPR